MSDLMLTAVLSMPYDMAMESELSRRQFWDRAQQALAEIERLRTRLEIDPRHPIDGIEARDATIREQDTEIERLTAALRAQPGPVSMDDVEWAGKAHLADAIRERDELKHDIAEYIGITGAQAQEISTLTAERDDLRRQLDEAQKEIHNLNWALGTEGYEQMATPEEQAEHEAAVHAHNEFLARLEMGKRAYDSLKSDAQRYRWLREHADGDHWYLYYDDRGLDLLQGDALDAAIDAAMGGGDAG